jgi:hypothetical protein
MRQERKGKMTKIRPTRKVKSGKNGFYEYETGCGKLAITIQDGEDGFPVRVIVEPKGGGCKGGIEYLRRSLTYILECNLDLDNFIEKVLEAVICPSAKEKMLREGRKDVQLSCSRAVSTALKNHLALSQATTKK